MNLTEQFVMQLATALRARASISSDVEVQDTLIDAADALCDAIDLLEDLGEL